MQPWQAIQPGSPEAFYRPVNDSICVVGGSLESKENLPGLLDAVALMIVGVSSQGYIQPAGQRRNCSLLCQSLGAGWECAQPSTDGDGTCGNIDPNAAPRSLGSEGPLRG